MTPFRKKNSKKKNSIKTPRTIDSPLINTDVMSKGTAIDIPLSIDIPVREGIQISNNVKNYDGFAMLSARRLVKNPPLL